MRAFFISILLSLILSSMSYACSCGEWPFDNSIEISDEIFIGELLEIKKEKRFFKDWYETVYIFEVSKKWKGSASDRLKIYTESGCSPVFYMFPGEYIIYAYKYSEIANALANNFNSDWVYENFGFLDKRLETMSCLRLKEVNWYEEEAPFRDEIVLLDSTFTEPVSLRPYYLNFTNLFLLIGVILAGIYVGNKNKKDKSS